MTQPERDPPSQDLPSDLVQERRQLEVAGHVLETCRYGLPDRPLRVVLLHEGLGSVAAWRDFPARLARQIREPVLAYSRAGHGDSSVPTQARHPGSMHHEAQVVVPALLQALGVEQPILIGHSEGASIALIHAGTNAPGPIPLGVVVMAPHLFVEAVTVAEIAKVNQTFASGGLAHRLARHHQHPIALFRSWADLWLSTPFLQWNIEAEVSAIQCPLLAIQGAEDQYGSPRQIERIAALRAHAKTLMLANCKHSPHREQADSVLAALTGFVAGLGQRENPGKSAGDGGKSP